MNYYPLDKIDQHHDQPCWCDECAEKQRALDTKDLADGVKLLYDNRHRFKNLSWWRRLLRRLRSCLTH